MKNIIRLAFLVLLVATMACEGPRDARSRRGATDDAFSSSTSTDSDNDDGGVTVADNDNGNTTSTDTGTQIPPEIDHCNWSTDGVNGFESSSTHLGSYTFCQAESPGVETDVYLQLQMPISDSQVCVIPTFNNGANSIYVGEPRCLSATDNKRIYKIGLIKNRPGYSNFAITGAMIMKDKAFLYPAPFNQYVLSPDAYLFCANFLDQYGDGSYCQAFSSVAQYKYHQF